MSEVLAKSLLMTSGTAPSTANSSIITTIPTIVSRHIAM
jgi:hypothetical protein